MKPAAFDYERPDTLPAALALKARYGDDAKFLAGGQSLVPAMNFRLARPTALIDLNGVRELDGVRVADDGGLRIGAMTRVSVLEREPLVAARAPLLREAAPHIAHAQIRNRGTVGGSLAHADPAAELPVAMVALGARLKARSVSAERWIEAREFFVTLFTTALAPEEMLVEIAIPPQPVRTGSAFVEFARRHGDYALMGAAAVATLNASGACERASLVFLNAGVTPMPATRSAAMLIGQRPSAQLFESVSAAAARDEIEPTGSVHASPEYQRHLARVLGRRALASAFERAGNSS